MIKNVLNGAICAVFRPMDVCFVLWIGTEFVQRNSGDEFQSLGSADAFDRIVKLFDCFDLVCRKFRIVANLVETDFGAWKLALGFVEHFSDIDLIGRWR